MPTIIHNLPGSSRWQELVPAAIVSGTRYACKTMDNLRQMIGSAFTSSGLDGRLLGSRFKILAGCSLIAIFAYCLYKKTVNAQPRPTPQTPAGTQPGQAAQQTATPVEPSAPSAPPAPPSEPTQASFGTTPAMLGPNAAAELYKHLKENQGLLECLQQELAGLNLIQPTLPRVLELKSRLESEVHDLAITLAVFDRELSQVIKEPPESVNVTVELVQAIYEAGQSISKAQIKLCALQKYTTTADQRDAQVKLQHLPPELIREVMWKQDPTDVHSFAASFEWACAYYLNPNEIELARTLGKTWKLPLSQYDDLQIRCKMGDHSFFAMASVNSETSCRLLSIMLRRQINDYYKAKGIEPVRFFIKIFRGDVELNGANKLGPVLIKALGHDGYQLNFFEDAGYNRECQAEYTEENRVGYWKVTLSPLFGERR